MIHWGWRASFGISAALAFAVVALWHWYVTDWPEEHPGVNKLEIEAIHPDVSAAAMPHWRHTAANVPWMKMLSSLSVWGLILGYGLQGYAFYVYYN